MSRYHHDRNRIVAHKKNAIPIYSSIKNYLEKKPRKKWREKLYGIFVYKRKKIIRLLTILITVFISFWLYFSPSSESVTRTLFDFSGHIMQIRKFLLCSCDFFVVKSFIWYWENDLSPRQKSYIENLLYDDKNDVTHQKKATELHYFVLEQENKKLKTMLNFNGGGSPKNYRTILTASIINKSFFMQDGEKYMIIAAGKKQGLKLGDFAHYMGNILGKITTISNNFSRIDTIFSTSINIDVIGEISNLRCLTNPTVFHSNFKKTKDGAMKMLGLQQCQNHGVNHITSMKKGDLITTSGIIDGIPAGLAVGIAVDDGVRVGIDFFALNYLQIGRKEDKLEIDS